MTEAILEAVDLEFEYHDGTKALNGISVSIEKGKKVVFLGPNGAGKSTLFLHFNGILRPARGKVRFHGKDVSYKHSALVQLRKAVGIVFQDPDSQLFSANVLQDISFGPLNLGLTKTEVAKRVKAAMKATEIEDIHHKPTHLLSYGQKKRVSIAGILAMDPEVIIFDEPTAWLDPLHADQLVQLMDKLVAAGKTVIVSTHDVDMAYSWADYVYVMVGGKVLGQGQPVEVFQDEELLQRAGLVKPWVLEVYQELWKKGWVSHGPLPRTKPELLDRMRQNSTSLYGFGTTS